VSNAAAQPNSVVAAMIRNPQPLARLQPPQIKPQ